MDRPLHPAKPSALFFGGVRSGKSRLAQEWVAAHGSARVYLATCRREPADAEMATRIARHQAERAGQGWTTIEEPLAVPQALAGCRLPTLIDCATLWLTNLGEALAWDETAILARVDDLCRVLARPPVPVAVVSNEIGLGVVPEHPLGRAFRDLQGFANQRLAAACHRVAFTAAGLPLWLKGAAPC